MGKIQGNAKERETGEMTQRQINAEKLQKRVIGKLRKCYSIAPLTWNKKEYFLVAAEKQDPCYLFDLKGNLVDKVWDGPGGVMSMVQVPGSDGIFLATRRFYSPNDSAEAEIVEVRPGTCGGWRVRSLVRLPFVHRFDILKGGDGLYLIACTLKSAHAYKDDWSSPGRVYAAKLPEDMAQGSDSALSELKVLKSGLQKNHGYCRIEEEGKQAALIACENGIYEFLPPEGEEGWEIRKLSDQPASDAVFADFDGDGERELGVIAPFHGNKVSILKKQAGFYREVYRYPEEAEFSHAIYGGPFCGRTMLIFGHRKGGRKLAAIWYDTEKKAYTETTIDSGCGAANIYCYEREGKSCLAAANREIDEIALYEEV